MPHLRCIRYLGLCLQGADGQLLHHPQMAQRTITAPGHYFVDPNEPPSRMPSPWATMTTPSPSPGPPPSPAVWMPHDWVPATRKSAPTRSLPLLPSSSSMLDMQTQQQLQALRTNTTFSPLPTHPEFLRGLQSHPMIIQSGEDVSRSPSPTSSVEMVRPSGSTARNGGNMSGAARLAAGVGSPVPFPSNPTPRVTSPSPMGSGMTSPRPLPRVNGSQGSQHSLRSVPSESSGRQSQAASPDSAAALSSPRRNPVAMPRPRLPAMNTSGITTGQPQAQSHTQSDAQKEFQRHPVFYMQEGMIVLRVSRSGVASQTVR